jgi:hypothetical protein
MVSNDTTTLTYQTDIHIPTVRCNNRLFTEKRMLIHKLELRTAPSGAIMCNDGTPLGCSYRRAIVCRDKTWSCHAQALYALTRRHLRAQPINERSHCLQVVEHIVSPFTGRGLLFALHLPYRAQRELTLYYPGLTR